MASSRRLIRKILVPTDGSDLSLAAAEYAAEVARCMEAEVVALNVAEVSGITQFVGYSLRTRREGGVGIREVAEDVLAKTKQVFLTADIPVRTKIVEGFAPEMIISEAEDGNYDLIVMGSHGSRGGALRRAFFGLGSVAEAVVSNSPCPVMVVRGALVE